MKNGMRVSVLALAAAIAWMAGCSRDAAPPPAAGGDSSGVETGEQPRDARVLPLPGETATAGTRPVHSGPLVWDVPEDWVVEQPASGMRHAQYRVPGPGGPGECVVFYFGPGRGGDAASNATRWAGQFRQPDGSPSVERMQMSGLTGTKVPVRIVEVTGTYDGGMTMMDEPAEQKTGYMLLGGIAEGADAPWFFKFTGPETTVRAQRAAFETMMRSIRPGA